MLKSSERYLSQLRTYRLKGRSRLHHQMTIHYAELSEAKAASQLTWGEFGALVRSMGMKDASGAPPSDNAVRKAWLRVSEAQAASSPAVQPVQAAVQMRLEEPEEPENEPINFVFRPSRPR